MTKKDFELIAHILFQAKPIASDTSERGRQWIKTINCFSERLAQENPRFNLVKFERAATTGAHIRTTIGG
jgi:hypothetical protein